jgi:hypothetical protein
VSAGLGSSPASEGKENTKIKRKNSIRTAERWEMGDGEYQMGD